MRRIPVFPVPAIVLLVPMLTLVLPVRVGITSTVLLAPLVLVVLIMLLPVKMMGRYLLPVNLATSSKEHFAVLVQVLTVSG